MQTYPEGLPPKAQHDNSFKTSNQFEYFLTGIVKLKKVSFYRMKSLSYGLNRHYIP